MQNKTDFFIIFFHSNKEKNTGFSTLKSVVKHGKLLFQKRNSKAAY